MKKIKLNSMYGVFGNIAYIDKSMCKVCSKAIDESDCSKCCYNPSVKDGYEFGIIEEIIKKRDERCTDLDDGMPF